jgi:hypothetical protein
MAVTIEISNDYKKALSDGEIDLGNNEFIAILMVTGYTFDPETDGNLAAVTGDQLATGNGYTQNAQVLNTDTYVGGGANTETTLSFVDPTWVPTGGGFGPTGDMIIYDNTHASKIVVGNVDFGQDYTPVPPTNFQPQGIKIVTA